MNGWGNNRQRRSIRLKRYDYSQSGTYFVTICTQNKACLFGEIKQGQLRMNDAGSMIAQWYYELENKFVGLQCDEFVCMPNHIHFIINITEGVTRHPQLPIESTNPVGADLRVAPNHAQTHHNPVGADLCARPVAPQTSNNRCKSTSKPEPKPGQTHRSAPTASAVSLANVPAAVQWLKTMTTNEYIRGVKQNGWPPFAGKLWQRNYWERIVRNEHELATIREYIQNNPARWEQDKLFIAEGMTQYVYTNDVQINRTPTGPTQRINPDHAQIHHNPIGANLHVSPNHAQTNQMSMGVNQRIGLNNAQTHHNP